MVDTNLGKVVRVPEGLEGSGEDEVSVARCVRAGDFVFLNGLHGMTGAAAGADALLARPQATRQAEALWVQAKHLLAACAADTRSMVRADQFFTSPQDVPFFHRARRGHAPDSAPSTSVLVPALHAPGARMTMDAMAWLGADGVQGLRPDGLDIPATSGFVPVVRAGGLIFVAGFMAAHGEGDLGGIAPQARLPAGHLWKGHRIQLETRYLIERKLVPALAAAGCSLAQVRHARVCLSDLEDMPAFNEVWHDAFAGRVPLTTFVPTSRPGFAIEDARVEINLIAQVDTAHGHAPADAAMAGVSQGHPGAGRVGDFLVVAGTLAADGGGAVRAAHRDRRGHLASDIEAQMHWLIDRCLDRCRQWDADPCALVKLMHWHTDLSDLLPACRTWQRRLPGLALPLTAMQVPRLPVPGCRVQVEAWFYAPRRDSREL